MRGREVRPAGPSARVAGLPAEERRILAALAIVGRATLSADELAHVVETTDVGPLVDDLERRGLIRLEERRRYSLPGRIAAEIRRLEETVETADRLLGYVETLARGGKLTAARLEQDGEAILGIAAWGAEVRRWETVLELVETVQSSFELAERFHEQRVLLELGRTAASRLGDRAAEAWMLERLTRLADRLGDKTAHLEHRGLADSAGRPGSRVVLAGGARSTLRAALFVVAAAGGAAAGWAVGHGTAHATTTVLTREVPVTRTLPGAGVTRTATISTTVVEPTTATLVATTTVPSVTTELLTRTATVTTTLPPRKVVTETVTTTIPTPP